MEPRHGHAWSTAEEQDLRNGFLAGITIADLALAHQRGAAAIEKRLDRLGLVPAPVVPAPITGVAGPATQPASDRLAARIDGLVASLLKLKTEHIAGRRFRKAVAEVTIAYDRLDAELLPVNPVSEIGHDTDAPLPDRLRASLQGVVRACVPDRKDCHVALATLGLAGDGEPSSLAAVGEELRVTSERVRQRRVRAYRRIDAVLPRRCGSAGRLRAVLAEASAGTDWADPTSAAGALIRLACDRPVPLQQLTVMCCRAAGASLPIAALRVEAKHAAAAACRDPEAFGRWHLDLWADAAGKVIFPDHARLFAIPPADMQGRKRTPGETRDGETIALRSDKLGRMVACESAMELRVFSWLERSPEILWYQEQPIAVPYRTTDRDRLYYPDAAAWDRDGRVVLIEVKPTFMMPRLETVTKAAACLRRFGPLGIGYLLVDDRGRTLSDLAYAPYDAEAADEIESLFVEGAASFRIVREILSRRSGRLDPAAFTSMAVNRDWAVTSGPGVRVSRLPGGLSFGPLLARSNGRLSLG